MSKKIKIIKKMLNILCSLNCTLNKYMGRKKQTAFSVFEMSTLLESDPDKSHATSLYQNMHFVLVDALNPSQQIFCHFGTFY